MAMAANGVIGHFDVVEDVRPRHVAGFVNTFLDALLLQAAEE